MSTLPLTRSGVHILHHVWSPTTSFSYRLRLHQTTVRPTWQHFDDLDYSPCITSRVCMSSCKRSCCRPGTGAQSSGSVIKNPIPANSDENTVSGSVSPLELQEWRWRHRHRSGFLQYREMMRRGTGSRHASAKNVVSGDVSGRRRGRETGLDFRAKPMKFAGVYTGERL